MDREQVERALLAIEAAKEAYEAMQKADSPRSFTRAWSNFLTHINRVFTRLEQASKTSGKSVAWYGRVKKIRIDNTLLCYLHHARNADEHGIKSVIEREEEQVVIKRHRIMSFKLDDLRKDAQPEPKVLMQVGPTWTETIPERMVVIDVRDRGKIYKPPENIGLRCYSTSVPALDIASVALQVIDQLHAEASSHLPPP